jgi:PAS domain S-box-containing protein
MPADPYRNAREQNRELFAALVENFPGMVYRCRNDRLWTMIYVSPGSESLTGYKPESLIENREAAFARLIHPDDREMVWDAVQAAVQRGENFSIEYRIRDKADREKWVWDKGRAVLSADGRMEAIEGLISDVTEHRQALKALQESERRHRFLWENITDIILICDEKGRYTYVSPSHKMVLGRGEEVLGSSIFAHVHPEDAPGMQQTFTEALASGRQARAVYRYLHPGRGYIWLESTGRRHTDAAGNAGGIITSRDITDRKTAEEALQISESKFRSIFDFSYQAIALTEAESGRLSDVNRKFCELTGFSKEEVLGRTTTDLGFYKPADRNRFIEELSAAGEVQGLEMDFTARDGSVLNAVMFARPLRISGRSYILTIFLDITDQKKMEAQIRQSQKMEAVGRLAGGVAHDFNNMLSVIMGYADMILGSLETGSEYYGHIQEIHKAAERSAALVRQLLAFSRRQTIEPRVVDLNQAVYEHKRMLDRLIGENVRILFQPEEDLWPTRIDPAQLDQILANLAVNARDAIKEVGTLRIETANVSPEKETGSRSHDLPPGEYVMLSFTDTGEGMDRRTLDKIFEPFFTTKEKEQGTGLGLATVYGIVTQNHGFIRVESEPGQGSSFKLYFPRSTQSPQPAAAGKKSRPPAGRETVLVVEDQEQVLNLTRTILEMNGYQVLAAATPAEALSLCAETARPIDLLLTDVIMPEMNGKELKEQISALQPDIRVLFMSGYTEDVISSNGVIDENLEFIRKPFSNSELAAKIRRVLDA